ncbi:MAG: serine-pyruvate aminotransferase [Actinomycetota bacterium]
MNRPEILMTPGPTPVPPEVLIAQSQPLVYHRGPAYGALLNEVIAGIRWQSNASGDIVVYTSSGTGGMEGSVANLVSAGDKVLVVSVGFFGERYKTMCERFGCDVTFIGYQWGQVAKAEDVAAALDADPEIKIVFIQHSETSTGVCNDIEPVAKVVKERGRLMVVDAISSVGAVELDVDGWGIDVCVGGSQKALGATPGIAFMSISEAAWAMHKTSTAPRFYFDWTAYKAAAARPDAESPWTPAISVLQGLAAAIKLAREEGLDNILERHKLLSRMVKAGVRGLELPLFGESLERSLIVTAVRVPDGLSDEEIVAKLRSRFGIVTGPGQGPLKGKIFRIGHLGWVAPLDVLAFFGALEVVLSELGYPLKLGAGVAAAQQALLDS